MKGIIKAIKTLHAVEFRVHWVCPQVGDGLAITLLLLLFATLLYIDAHDGCGHYVFLDNRASDRAVMHVITYMIIHL